MAKINFLQMFLLIMTLSWELHNDEVHRPTVWIFQSGICRKCTNNYRKTDPISETKGNPRSKNRSESSENNWSFTTKSISRTNGERNRSERQRSSCNKVFSSVFSEYLSFTLSRSLFPQKFDSFFSKFRCYKFSLTSYRVQCLDGLRNIYSKSFIDAL